MEKCFVMMPFSTPSTYEDADHFNKIYEQVFKPAIEKAGYEPYRVDQDKISDSIVGKIFDAVRTCPMALCDLSSRNPNVLYELGLRQAYNLPVVLVQDDITERIFDVSGISTVMYKNHRLVENVEEAIMAISEAITQTKAGQNKTLANIVKAQKADYDSIEVDENDHIEILLKALVNDVKELKMNQRADSHYRQIEEIRPFKKNMIHIMLKEGVSNKEIEKTMMGFQDDVAEWRREDDVLSLVIYSSTDEKCRFIAEVVSDKLGLKINR